MFAPDVRQRAARPMLDHEPETRSRWMAIMSIASKIGCMGRRLNELEKEAEVDAFNRTGVATEMATKLKVVESENWEPRRVNEIRRKVSACFSHAEFDRPSKI